MKYRYLKYFLPCLFLFMGCTRNFNNFVPVGRYCGQSTAPYENPFSLENINETVFSEITPESLEEPLPIASSPQIYRAQTVSVLFKNNEEVAPLSDGTYIPDEQIQYTHSPVYVDSLVTLSNFRKTCTRGLTPESAASFEAILPVEITLDSNLTWTASESLRYVIEYGPEFESEGFLIGRVEAIDILAPADISDFSFINHLFLKQIGDLNRAQREMRAIPESALNQISMLVQVSADPEIFARIDFTRVIPPVADEEQTED